jgi:zeaxanthin glucosyltransferase
MRLLVIAPDYLSHYLPLGEVASAWRGQGGSVVVATGPGMRARAADQGFGTADLRLGGGRNSGIAQATEQDDDEARRLGRFLEVTRAGPIATLSFQAEQRRHDLLWHPLEVAASVHEIVDTVRPDVILADQLAFAATLALRAHGHRYAGFVTGHPTAVPAPGEIYGVPPSFPAGIVVDPVELSGLRAHAASVSATFSMAYAQSLRQLDPHGQPPDDAFAATGAATLFNYPEALHAGSGRVLPPGATFLGAVARHEAIPADLDLALPRDPSRLRVYASLGTFLSSRVDLLRLIADGLRTLPVDVVMAIGATDPAEIGPIPDHWIVRPSLPQVALLERCDVVITHGGNNTVTESLRAGLPMLVLPLSTDQFAGAADVERAGVGRALDARTLSGERVAAAVQCLANGPESVAAASLGIRLRVKPGAKIAVERLRALAADGVGQPTGSSSRAAELMQ